jgi:dipeptidyl aminopeptidase/acylaminoacyl peptidase
MSTAADAPFGTWTSPIGADDLLRGARGMSAPRGIDGALYWMESRPTEGGRTTIMRRCADGTLEECLPAPWNARSRVHEYGGICYAVRDERLWFTQFGDQRIHVVDLSAPGRTPLPVTPEDGSRWADFAVDAGRGRLIAVGEVDRKDDEPRNFIAAIPMDGGAPEELASGCDFYAAPRLAPDGDRLSWLEWDHPCMPWDGTRLRCAGLDAAGRPGSPETLAGGPEESVFQPDWLADGRLLFVSDRSGWWNLYLHEEGASRCLCPMEADFGLPLWQFGMRTWVQQSDGRIACIRHTDRGQRLGRIDPDQGGLETLDLPWTGIDGLTADGDRIAFVGAGPDRFPELVRLDRAPGDAEIVRTATDLALDARDISRPEALAYPTGEDGSARAHAWFHRPAHRSCRGAPGERPPLIVVSHGGPTAATSPVLNLKIQFWTSRGFAVLDVDYRGSTGYGRAYRDALKGGWGRVDVEDCVAGARFLVERGEVDPDRLAIRGSSAGGLTVLGALAFHDLFRAGTSLYGVADLSMLAQDTHKFESRYLDTLVGPWPEARAVYEARSPLHHADRLQVPVLFLQGLEDRIVPPSQAEAMVSALDARGIPVAYVPFEGEQHGFRQAATIRRALEAELYFYGRVFDFEPAGPLEPVPIRNL